MPRKKSKSRVVLRSVDTTAHSIKANRDPEDRYVLYIYNGVLYDENGLEFKTQQQFSDLNFTGRLWLEPAWLINKKIVRIYVAKKYGFKPIFGNSCQAIWRSNPAGMPKWIEDDAAFEIIGLRKDVKPVELEIDDGSGLPSGFSLLELKRCLYACSFINQRAVIRVPLEGPDLAFERRIHISKKPTAHSAVDRALGSRYESKWILDPTIKFSEASEEYIRSGLWQDQA